MNKGIRRQSLLRKKIAHLRMAVFDFDGVFTDNRVLVMQDGTEGVFCNRADGIGLEKLRRLGLKLQVISTEKNPVVLARCRKLDLPCAQGCEDKAQTLRKIVAQVRIPLTDVLYMGNDVNDLECLKIVGLPVCVADSHPDVGARCFYKTKARGGHGAVRELCDKIAEIRQAPFKKRTS